MTVHTYTAVLDRIVDDRAVLLLEADGETTDQFDVPVAVLPEGGRHEGAVFAVDYDADRDELREARYRPDSERDRRRSAQDRLDRLSERLSDHSPEKDPEESSESST